MMLNSHKSGVVYNNKTIYHSLVAHELVAKSVLLDYLKYSFNFSDLLLYETSR